MLYEQYDSSGHKKSELEASPCYFSRIALLFEIFKWKLCEAYTWENSLKWDRNYEPQKIISFPKNLLKILKSSEKNRT